MREWLEKLLTSTQKCFSFLSQVLTLVIKKAPKFTSPDCTFFSCLPSDVGDKRQSLGTVELDAWDVEGGAVWKGGGGAAPWLPPGQRGRYTPWLRDWRESTWKPATAGASLHHPDRLYKRSNMRGWLALWPRLLQCKALWGEKQFGNDSPSDQRSNISLRSQAFLSLADLRAEGLTCCLKRINK